MSSNTEGKVIKCNAAIIWHPIFPFENKNEEVWVGIPRKGEARVKIVATGLTSQDGHVMSNHSALEAIYPTILGHEATGIVESVGENTDFEKGDQVVVLSIPNCGKCSLCLNPATNLCLIKEKFNVHNMLDGTSRFKTVKDNVIINHFLGVSTWSEYTVIHQSQLVKVDVPAPMLREIVPISSGFSTGYGAARNVKENDVVVIFDLSIIGLAAAYTAKQQKAAKIIGVDTNNNRGARALQFGLTDFINPNDYKEKRAHDVIKAITNGQGANVAIDCFGGDDTLQETFLSTANFGTMVVAGIPMRSGTFHVPAVAFVSGITVQGSLSGGLKPKESVLMLVEKHKSKEIDVNLFNEDYYRLADLNQSIMRLHGGLNLRPVVVSEEPYKILPETTEKELEDRKKVAEEMAKKAKDKQSGGDENVYKGKIEFILE